MFFDIKHSFDIVSLNESMNMIKSGWGGIRPITMGLGSAGSHKKNPPRKKRILKIGLLEHEIHPIKVQKLLTFVLNYKDQ